MTDPNLPAFPEPERISDYGTPFTELHGYRNRGMTIREHYAGLAMQGRLSADFQRQVSMKEHAAKAAEAADALLAALEATSA